MREFRAQSPHSKVMPKLANWCDEAAVAHWVQESTDFPDWQSASERLRTTGRLLKVSRPSEQQKRGVVNVA